MGGINSTSYDDAKEYNDTGVSLTVRRLAYDGKSKNSGMIFMANFPGINPVSAYTLTLGYGFKTGDTFFVEAAAGFYYGSIWGTGTTFVLGTGYNFGQWYISLPVIIQGSLFIKVVPMIGIYF